MIGTHVYFPRTNPIVFTRKGDYEPYKDAALREHKALFCQQFHENDLISWQMRIEREEGFRFELYIIINGKEVHYGGLSIGRVPATIGGFYNFFYIPINSGEASGNGSGIVGFSRRVSEIREKDIDGGGGIFIEGRRLINDGDRFHFKIEITYKNDLGNFDVLDIFESNDLICKNDTSFTKLIHYDYTEWEDYLNFGTLFNYMTKGYDIRLQCEFLPLNQKANKEIFQTYNGSSELVSAVPYETVNLAIGLQNGVGVPDCLIRNLNYIFHLNEKTIDGVPYELVEGSELEMEIMQGYNHRFLRIELCKKNVEDWKAIEIKDPNQIQLKPQVFIEYENVNEKETGQITIKYDRDFYLLDAVGQMFDIYTFSQISGSGTDRITFDAVRNTTGSTIVTTINIIDKYTHEIVGDIVLELPSVARGVCFWKICETFHIAC